MNRGFRKTTYLFPLLCLLSYTPLFAQDTTIAKGSSGVEQIDSIPLSASIDRFEMTDSIQWNIAALNTGASANYLTVREKLMVQEINMVRAYPKRYATFATQYLTVLKNRASLTHAVKGYTINKSYLTINGVETVTTDTVWSTDPTQDAIAATKELIDLLKNMKPVSILKPMQCVYIAAKKHGLEGQKNGALDHQGSDGSWPDGRIKKECPSMTDGNENMAAGSQYIRQIVMELLVDAGIPSRGHRLNLLDPEWLYIACYDVGTVADTPNYWLQEFAK